MKFMSTGLWGLVNNAGVWYFSELEMTSDKVMRRVIRSAHLGLDLGNVTALENPSTVGAIQKAR